MLNILQYDVCFFSFKCLTKQKILKKPYDLRFLPVLVAIIILLGNTIYTTRKNKSTPKILNRNWYIAFN